MIEVGKQLGGYTILDRIGRGGMGEVFLAQHRRVARRAAVKVLVPELSQRADVLDRFFNEARATSLIRHPGIVEILDCDVVDGQAFIIMEFLDGENLGGYLNRAGSLAADLPFLLGAGVAAAGAVAAAHATGIIHRDLKPDNIYLHLAAVDDPAVTVKVLDFGIAKLVLKDGGPSHTSTGMLLGTPTYMSPEQCRGAGRVDLRSDVYSLGCILYECICGSPPFVREGGGDLIVAHVSETPEPPSRHVPGLSPALNSLVVRMLAKKPEERPRSMEDVRDELRQCAQSLAISLDGPLRPQVPVKRPPVEGETGPTPADERKRSDPAAKGTLPLGAGPQAAPARLNPGAASGFTALDAFSGPQLTNVSGGETRSGPIEKPTTLGSTASELRRQAGAAPNRKARWLSVAVGAVALVGGVAALVASRAGSSSPVAVGSKAIARPEAEEKSMTVPSAQPASPAPVAVPSAAPAAVPSPTAVAVVAPAPEPIPEVRQTVSIDIQGLPTRTKVTVDGRSATLPVQLQRGPRVHHIVLRPPGSPERALEVDGTKDRIIEMAFDQRASAAPGQVNPQRPPIGKDTGSGHRQQGLPREPTSAPPKKTVPRSTDRQAITDI